MKTDFTFVKKATAVTLSTLFFVLGVLSFLGIVYAAECDFYGSTYTQVMNEVQTESLRTEAAHAFNTYFQNGGAESLLRDYENTDFRVEFFDAAGTKLFSNLGASDTVLESVSVTRYLHQYTAAAGDVWWEYTVTAYMVEGGELLFAMELGFARFIFAMRFIFIGLVAVFLMGVVISFVYLLFVAGKHRRDEAPRVGPVEKLPFDLYVALYAFITFLAIYILDAVQYDVHDILFIVIIGIFVVCGYLLLLGFFMSISIRLRTHTIWKNTLIYIVFSFIGRKLSALFRAIPLVPRTVIVLALYCLFDIITYLILMNQGKTYILFMILKMLILVPLVIYLAYCFRLLKKGAETIKSGDYEKEIDTQMMLSDFKSFGETLNTVSDGLAGAVDARMKSERMKTELITNVSHDIKTPLTSIINYADLLKKEAIANETAVQYIEVIDRQATRMKKLITDLVEASKASTGNINVHLETCDVTVLLEQAAGEYDEKLRGASLIPVLHIPEEPIYISADGRLLWRVFDNLLGNICKYSLAGTRVYLDVAVYGELCIISFKNISGQELNIPPEELLERFVRADSSRSTEGNGLGLSIAQSLIDLMGGTLELHADGDLFKVMLSFPVLQKT